MIISLHTVLVCLVTCSALSVLILSAIPHVLFLFPSDTEKGSEKAEEEAITLVGDCWMFCFFASEL